MIRAVKGLGNGLFWDNFCPVQALAAQLLFRRNRFATTVHIAVPGESIEKVKACAWLEHDRIVLIGGLKAMLVSYTPLLALGAQTP